MSRWCGSLENRLMETSTMPKPEVGMGATECLLFFTKKGVWRERYADRSLGCTRFVIGFAERYYDPSF